jgi:membrane protein
VSGSDAEQPGDRVADAIEPLRARGWLVSLRARADHAADSYQQLAQQRPLLGLPLAFVARYTARQGLLLASAVAFRMFLWLMPLALLLAGVFGGISGGKSGNLESASKAAGITGTASQQVVSALRDGHQSWWIAVLIGGLAFLWTTRTLMRNLTLVTAHAWQAPVPKPRQRDVLATTALFAGGVILLLATTALVVRLDQLFPGGLYVAIVLQGICIAAGWALICLRLPDRRTTWTDLIPGSLLVGLGLAVMHALSRVYIPRRLEQSSQLYGTLGVAGVILAWLLAIGQLIVSGAIVNSVWTEYRVERGTAG